MPSVYVCRRPISISLGTSDPHETRRLVRRMAVKWDELLMLMTPKFERGHLNLDEQETFLRQGLKDELARATAARTAPIGAASGNVALHKIMAAAYRIVSRVPHDAAAIDAKIVEAEVDENWDGREVLLLWKALRLLVTPMSVSRTMALDAVQESGSPVNEGTIQEARSQLLRGYAEAHVRASLFDHPLVKETGRGALALLDDELIAKVLSQSQSSASIQPPIPEVNNTQLHEQEEICDPCPLENPSFERRTSKQFSEIIQPTLSALQAQKNGRPKMGNGKG